MNLDWNEPEYHILSGQLSVITLLIREDRVETTGVFNSVILFTCNTHQSTYGHPPADMFMPGLRVYVKWLITFVFHFEEN